MIELGPDNTLAWLHAHGWLPKTESATVLPLAWGVSNVVMRVTPESSPEFVVKQSRTQLRTKDPWFSRLDRIWREADAMRVLAPLLPPSVIPRVLCEDRSNYVFSMEAAPADHSVWKQSLLAGILDASVAGKLGNYLAILHRSTAAPVDQMSQFLDRQVFIELRVDPFYRRVISAAPDVQVPLQAMIDEMFATQACLVHGDFSPKNVLETQDGLFLVDFETVHLGDPAFDLGFFLSHILLKTILHRSQFSHAARLSTTFWSQYLAELTGVPDDSVLSPHSIVRRMFPHLAGCMWARIDGTSKIDYLQLESEKSLVRNFCRELLLDPPNDWAELLVRLETGCHQIVGNAPT